MDPKNNIHDFFQMYFPHYAGSTKPSPATKYMLEMTRRFAQNTAIRRPLLDEEYPTAAATGWAPMRFTTSKWHYFKEGAVFSACGLHRAEDLASQADFHDANHRSSDHCAKCQANRETYLSIAIQVK